MLKAASDLFDIQIDSWHTHFPPIPNPSSLPGKKIVLSGCTGFLGRAIPGQLLQRLNISEIYFLVHKVSEDDDAKNALVSEQRVRDIIDRFDVSPSFSAQVKIMVISTTERWTREGYHELANGLTDIIHAAWLTDPFRQTKEYVEHLQGLNYIYNVCKIP